MELQNNRLSKLDIFGLVSGSVGLLADVISLSALFSLTKASLEVPTSSWITTVILIVYTSVIVGFYSRRILCYLNRGKAKEEKFTRRDYARIEAASVAITSLITATLWLMFLWGVYQSVTKQWDQELSKKIQEITEKYEKMKSKVTPKEIAQLEESKQSEIKQHSQGDTEALVFGGFFVLFISGLLIGLLNLLSQTIYKGCDTKYQAA